MERTFPGPRSSNAASTYCHNKTVMEGKRGIASCCNGEGGGVKVN